MEEKSLEVLTPGPDESAIGTRGYSVPDTGIERSRRGAG